MYLAFVFEMERVMICFLGGVYSTGQMLKETHLTIGQAESENQISSNSIQKLTNRAHLNNLHQSTQLRGQMGISQFANVV